MSISFETSSQLHDHYDEIVSQATVDIDTDNVNRVLCMSGGGTHAAFFTMGMVQYLVNHDLFDKYDTFSATSGSTIILTFIEPCYAFQYPQKYGKEWFNKCVREPVYGIVNERIFLRFFIQMLRPINWFRGPSYVADSIIKPLFKTVLWPYDKDIVPYSGKLFEYNYINGDRWHVTSDNSDLWNPQTGEFVYNFWMYRMIRCTLPAGNVAGVFSLDAGMVDTNAVSTVLEKYHFQELTLSTIETDFNEDLPAHVVGQPPHRSLASFFKFIVSCFTTFGANAPNRMNLHLSALIFGRLKKIGKQINFIYPRINELYSSPDDIRSKIYNGVLFYDDATARTVENIGYMEAHRTFGNGAPLLDSQLPNPQFGLSNAAEVRQRFDAFKNTSLAKYIARDVWNMYIRPVVFFWKAD